MELDKNRSRLPPTSPGYDFQGPTDFAPWAVDTTFGPGYSYSPKTQVDKSASSPFSLSGNQSAWPNLDGYPRAPLSIPVTSSMPFTGDELIPPEAWTFETDSDSCDISPVDGRHPALEVDAAPDARWSWSQPSSPSPEMESSIQTRVKYKSPSTSSYKSNNPSARVKPAPKLRTASHKTRRPASKSPRNAAPPSEIESVNTDEILTPEELRARRNHNLVEKQYRNRLNAQFERLLSVLPTDQQCRPGYGGNGGGSFGGGDANDEGGAGDDKRMSKAEVLDVATRCIKELEMKRRRLQRERKELLQSMEMMSGAVPRSNIR